MKSIQVLEHLEYALSFKTSPLKRFLAVLWLLAFILSGLWTAPVTKNPNDPNSSSDWNTYVRDNLNYLLSGRQYVQLAPFVGVADKTVTTSAAFADADATNIILTLTPASTRVKVWFTFFASVAAGNLYWDIFCTTLNARAGDSTVGLVGNTFTGATVQLYRVEGQFTGLTPGVPTSFKLQAKNPGGNVTIKENAVPVSGMAQEF